MTIPDWAWKVLQLIILPVSIWAIATHVTVKNHELKMESMHDKIEEAKEQIDDTQAQIAETHKKIAGNEDDISQTQKDIEVLKVRMEYVVKGIDDIKDMLKEDQR